MTDEEKIGRMINCAYNPPGGFLCQMGGYPPFDCGFCEDYIDATKGNEEVEDDMSGLENVQVFVPANELWGSTPRTRSGVRRKWFSSPRTRRLAMRFI